MKKDEKVFEEIYNKYFNDICRFISCYTDNYQIVEDVVQEVFLKVWSEKKIKDIKFVKTYLLNSARNKILNYLRDQENQKNILTEWAMTELKQLDSNDCIDRNLFFVYLHEAIEILPPKCREVFIASRQQQMTYKEIADKLNISIKTVENQMGIAMKKIREYVRSHIIKSKANTFYFIFI